MAERRTPTKRRRVPDAAEQAALLAEVVEAKRRDPAVREWSTDAEAAVGDGSIWKRIESQPEPHDLVEQWQAEHS